jgi:IS30 family transposase
MAYGHLTYLQRCKIQAYHQAGYYQNQIAKEIGVSPSTVSRELKRNLRWNGAYSASQADAFYKKRRKQCRKPKTFTEPVRAIVRALLERDWSPEQISGFGREDGSFSVSHERIYQYVLADKKEGGELYQKLRCRKKKYRKRYGSKKRTGSIKNRVPIDLRPVIVDRKERIGDWEVDTVISKNRTMVIVTLVERVSKLTLISNVIRKKATIVADEMIRLLTPFKSHTLTITSDNGCEFAEHERVAEALDASFYFARPYSSWERGLNENTNGLIRQYIKKGSDFSHVQADEINEITNLLNTRPRKALGFSTPISVFGIS